MTPRKKVKIDEAPPYPTNAEAKFYAAQHKASLDGGFDCHTAHHEFQHNQTVNVKTTWGCNGIFFVFAYPPAGFIITRPEDVLKLQIFEGWILEHQAQDNIFNLLVKASRDGLDFFWQEHKRHTH
ncbi:hypothetical protein ES703_53459 [subsurface metagenome]